MTDIVIVCQVDRPTMVHDAGDENLLTVNPYESPIEGDELNATSPVQEQPTVTEMARLGSLAGGFVGATYGAMIGLAIAIYLTVYMGVFSHRLPDVLRHQWIAFYIGMTIVGTFLGVCNGAVIGTIDGIVLSRLGMKFQGRLNLLTIVGFGWVSGYQAYFETRIATEYLSRSMGTGFIFGRSGHVWMGSLLGCIGGALAARSLVSRLANVWGDTGAQPK